jgi:hypothetical protein
MRVGEFGISPAAVGPQRVDARQPAGFHGGFLVFGVFAPVALDFHHQVKPIVGAAPGVDAQDEVRPVAVGRGVVLLLLVRYRIGDVEFGLFGSAFALLRLGNRCDELGAAPRFGYLLGRLTRCVQRPVPRWVPVGRVEDGFFEEQRRHPTGPWQKCVIRGMLRRFGRRTHHGRRNQPAAAKTQQPPGIQARRLFETAGPKPARIRTARFAAPQSVPRSADASRTTCRCRRRCPSRRCSWAIRPASRRPGGPAR